ncbi:uncharacterized protein LOC124159542 [Ischnura elegans]|uniref:uncharacterized protein LOC124159542 n=1 Tax=Ischnura elegans TaxID=197161 RepID=UPI001ED8AC58|nr:uncharacterized protein LOC124159542 [Ischnura elegans]
MKKGLMCETCTNAVYCKPDSKNPGKFNEESPTTCTGDFSCDELSGGCVVNGVCRYNDKFHCPRTDSTDTITYPDPYDCKKYYTCEGKTATSVSCKDKTAFDPKQRKCVDDSGDLCKDYPVPLCKEKGQSGVIAGTNYSYECIQGFAGDGTEFLYPMFNPEDSATTTPTTTASSATATTASTANDTTTAATASTPSSANPSETTTIGTTSTQPGYKCPGVGNYADPSNCKCFHMCYMYAGKIQEKYTCCRDGSYFSPDAQRCIAGNDC